MGTNAHLAAYDLVQNLFESGTIICTFKSVMDSVQVLQLRIGVSCELQDKGRCFGGWRFCLCFLLEDVHGFQCQRVYGSYKKLR